MGQKLNLFFDLDGTLIDISERHYQVYRSIILELRGAPLSKTIYWKLKRNKSSISVLLSRSRLPKIFLHDYQSRFIEKIEELKFLELDKIFNYTIPTLDSLSKTSNLYLITFRQSVDLTNKQLKKLKLTDKFIDIKVGRLDPSGVKTKNLMVKQVKPGSNVMIIGDTEDDILTAKKLSIPSIAVTSGLRSKKKLEEYNPTYLIRNISYLLKIINSLVH